MQTTTTADDLLTQSDLRITQCEDGTWMYESLQGTDIGFSSEAAAMQAFLAHAAHGKSYFEVSANGHVFGVWPAESEQEAINLCAQDAGYKSIAHMEASLERLCEMVAVKVGE